MKKILKEVVGVDVDQKKLVVSLGRLHEDLEQEIYAHKVFDNNTTGFSTLISWVTKLTSPDVKTCFVMEATGVYHESLAYFLDENGKTVSIVLPNKISNYFRTLEVKTITDKSSSEAIASFGLSRSLNYWKQPSRVLKRLKQLSRERDQLICERTVVKNQLHAENAEAEPYTASVQRMNERITLLGKQEKEILKEIKLLIASDQEINQQVKLACTIPGVGILTSVIVLAETNGFEHVKSKRQLVSYAGLDVREKQSGTSVKGKPRISKRGNRYLRKAMYLPALAAIRSNEHHQQIFARLVGRHGIKMKAAVAIQRKLLELIYVLIKNNSVYDEHYLKSVMVV
jgi:transposase